jgi:hypothetical protein
MAWTLADALAKREEILKSLDIARTQYGDKSVEYSNRKEALSVINDEISRLSSSGSYVRSTIVQHSRG